jgi:hypothetical protein
MPTEAQKQAAIKWRQTHREQYRSMTLKHVHASRNKWHDYNNEVKKFRKILFDGFIPIQ